MIWFVFTILALLASAIMLAPLLFRETPVTQSDDGAGAVLVDQIDEVQRDFDRGLISAEEAVAAKVEIKRRILALSRRKTIPDTAGRTGSRLLILAGILVPVLATGYYGLVAVPGLSGPAFTEGQAGRPNRQEVTELVQKLLERLQNDPSGGPSDGWMLLGGTYMRMGLYTDAVAAFETVSRRDDANSATFSMLAEALISAEKGIVTAPAEAAIDRALLMDPRNPAASFYKSRALAQSGQEAAAHDLLLERLDAADGFAPWMEVFVAEANRIGGGIGREPLSPSKFAPVAGVAPPGPDAADAAAAEDMSEEDRAEFIRSMVARLAGRLQEEPDDLDGWLRLGNAYRVLGETERAREAFRFAEGLVQALPEGDARRATVRQSLAELERQ